MMTNTTNTDTSNATNLQEALNFLVYIHVFDALKSWLMFFTSRLSKWLVQNNYDTSG